MSGGTERDNVLDLTCTAGVVQQYLPFVPPFELPVNPSWRT